jgi:small-conductance mechanosensitive channel
VGFTRRSLLAGGGFLLDMLPVLAFAIVGIGLGAIGGAIAGLGYIQQPATRLIMMVLIYAHVVWWVVTAVAYRLTSPDIARLRPLPLDDADAGYAYRWARRILTVLICALAALEIAKVLGITYVAYAALLKLTVLVVHLMLIVVVLHCRRGVARRIRGEIGSTGALGMVRGWIAAIWHLAAIFIILALWVVWAADIRHGYMLILRYFLSTAAVLLAAQLLSVVVLRGLDRLFSLEARDFGRFSTIQERASRYYPLVRRLVMVAGAVLTLLVLLQVWGVDIGGWLWGGGVGSRLLSAAVIVGVAGIVSLAVWEGVNAAVERHLDDLSHRGDRARSARLRTLLPLLRTSLLVFVVGVVGLTALSEIGVNIAPLLAGAGIVGVAIGFGSQKLVQDVITGVFLLLENVMHVGDWVTVGGLSGSVENLSIRTIRLRAGDGSVHVIPFSSVTTVTNTNRGIGNAAISVAVAYDEDTDRVGEVLKEIGAEMRQDPAFGSMILDDFALWGVDSVDGGGVTILGQLRCLDSGRWGVQREFNRRIKKRFQELGIVLADPARRLLVAPPAPPQPQTASAPPGEPAAPGPTSATDTRSPPPAALGHGA